MARPCHPPPAPSAPRSRPAALSRALPEMAGFSASSFKSKLEKLSESQQSIQTLSHWVQYHKKSVKESAAIWAKQHSQSASLAGPQLGCCASFGRAWRL